MQGSQVWAHFRHAVALPDGNVFGVPLLNQRNGHRFAPNNEVIEVRKICRLEFRKFRDHFQHGRHPHKQGAALRFKRRKHRRRIEFFHHAGVAAVVEKGQRQYIPAARVERGHTIDGTAFRIDNERHRRIDAVPKQHLMGIQRTFWETRGARGVQDKNGVVFFHRLHFKMVVFRQFDARGAKIAQYFQLPMIRRQPRGRGVGKEVLEFFLRDEQRRRGITDQEVNFSSSQTVIKRHQNNARFLGSNKKRQIFQTIFSQHGNTIPNAQPKHFSQVVR